MSTRAQIAIQIGPEEWAHVYVHFDGYPVRIVSFAISTSGRTVFGWTSLTMQDDQKAIILLCIYYTFRPRRAILMTQD